MRLMVWRIAFVCAALSAGAAARAQGTDATPFTLTTLDTGPGQLAMAQVDSGHGCKGGNKSPAMQWSGAPQGTKSFAVTLLDTTARSGAGFRHWALFDMPAGTRQLAAGEMPAGVKVGRNDFGDLGYGGVCPPPGQTHSYKLTVWALGDASIPFDAGAPDHDVEAYLNAHAIGSADLTLTYRR